MPSTATKPSPLRRALPLIGVALLAWVLTKLDARAMLTAFDRVDLHHFLAACGAFAFNLVLKSWRWQRMLAWQSIHLPSRIALAAFFSGQFYGQVTIGRVGELMRAEALTKQGVSPGRALSACLIDRVLDLGLVACTATILSALLVADAGGAIVASIALLLLTVIGLVALQHLADAHSAQRLGTFASRPAIARGLDFLVELLTGARPLLRPLALLESLAWTGVAWIFYFATLWLLAGGMDLHASRTLLTAAAALAGLSTLLPITVSGLGAREVIFAQMMQTQGIADEAAVVLALLHLGVMMLTTVVLGAAGLLVRQRQLASIEAPLERTQAS